MPYIMMKRDDIPDGTLQVLDLDPNTSLRNLTLDVPGQTKYVNQAQNDNLVLYIPTGMERTVFKDTRGLAAWIITNVPDVAGVQSAGAFFVGIANAVEGDSVTVDTTPVGGPLVTLTCRASPTSIFEVQIASTPNATASNLAGVINNPAVGLASYVFATPPGSAQTCLMTAVQPGVAGDTIVLSDSGGDVLVSGAMGTVAGVNAGGMTADEANDSATDILVIQLGLGDLTDPALALTVGAINGVMAAGAITAAQLSEVLDIIAGREYFVPAGTLVEDAGVFEISPAVGTPNGPRFITGTNRMLFLNDGLTLSVATGELEGFLDSGFIYAGVAGSPNGEAVAVYNDDGTLFTP